MLGTNQIFILEHLYDKPDTVASIALSFNICCNDVEDFDGEHIRQWRFVTRRALVGMEKRGLVEKVGMGESITPPFGTDQDPASAYAGERVPKGYTRQSVLWAITDRGRQTLDDHRATLPCYEPTPEQAAKTAAIVEGLKAAFGSLS